MDMEIRRSADPKEWLQQEWALRREKNSAFSLRSFAKYLQIAPGRLSEILSGKRKISLEMAEHISARLGLDPKSKGEFISAVLKIHRSGVRKGKRSSSSRTDQVDPNYQQLTIDSFHVISDWYHFAILNLRDCDDFICDENWIAKRLNISLAEVRLALVRLERLALIEWRGKTWVRTHAHLTTTHDVRSGGLRKGHRGIIQKAMDSLETVDVDARDITNMTMAINPKKLLEAKKKLARFRRQLSKFLESGNDRTEVYTLALQLFPLTEIRKGKS